MARVAQSDAPQRSCDDDVPAAWPPRHVQGDPMTRAMDRPQIDEQIDDKIAELERDPFPVRAVDHITFIVGNAKQAAHYYSTAFGMTLVAYRGPEHGYRDHAEYVLKSGSAMFVLAGGIHAESEATKHYARHGDGIIDVALEVPDVDANYTYAIKNG